MSRVVSDPFGQLEHETRACPSRREGTMSLPDGQLEWLETNQLGSFALGNVDRKLRRKYHALLTVRDPGHGDAWNVLADVREQLARAEENALLVDPISGESQHSELVSFHAYPHARHRYRALDVEIERCVRLHPEHDQVELLYRVRRGRAPLRLSLEPLLRCRPLHELTQENPFLDGACERQPATLVAPEAAPEDALELRMRPYAGMPPIALRLEGASARFEEQGSWHAVPHYDWEAARGYASREALFSPGKFVLELDRDVTFRLVIALRRCVPCESLPSAPVDLHVMAKLERAAAQFWMQTPPSAAERTAAARGTRGARGASGVIAGFPWFGAWSRDALIALPGLYLASLDWERCAGVLDSLARARVNGLIPNIPACTGAPADTSSVDASLLFARTVQWFEYQLGAEAVARFMPVVCELLEALADGGDPRMRFDHGVAVFTLPGRRALTWMDAYIDGAALTPRAGSAVDIDALAYNAAHFACAWADAHKPTFARAFRIRLRHAEADFLARYWDDLRGYLADGHDGQRADASLRPNQLWALALPYRPIPLNVARASLQLITRELFTPAGLRTLSPRDRAYRGRYAGTQPERDRAYHQGSVWPWLLGVYADAVRATHGRGALAARLGPALSHLAKHLDEQGCIGQISELFDGDAPHAAGGAPAQAWSCAETYRTLRMLHEAESVAEEAAPGHGKTQPPAAAAILVKPHRNSLAPE
jgi:predicted glycogen debranching enzyme